MKNVLAINVGIIVNSNRKDKKPDRLFYKGIQMPLATSWKLQVDNKLSQLIKEAATARKLTALKSIVNALMLVLDALIYVIAKVV